MIWFSRWPSCFEGDSQFQLKQRLNELVQRRVRRGLGNWDIGCFPHPKIIKSGFCLKRYEFSRNSSMSILSWNRWYWFNRWWHPFCLKKKLPPPTKRTPPCFIEVELLDGWSNDFVLIILAWWNNPSYIATYCWWTKSCTTKDDDYPIIYRVLTIPGGAGFCPSTVCEAVTSLMALGRVVLLRTGRWELPFQRFAWANCHEQFQPEMKPSFETCVYIYMRYIHHYIPSPKTCV